MKGSPWSAEARTRGKQSGGLGTLPTLLVPSLVCGPGDAQLPGLPEERAAADSLRPKPLWPRSAHEETCNPERVSPLDAVCFLRYVVLLALI